MVSMYSISSIYMKFSLFCFEGDVDGGVEDLIQKYLKEIEELR